MQSDKDLHLTGEPLPDSFQLFHQTEGHTVAGGPGGYTPISAPQAFCDYSTQPGHSVKILNSGFAAGPSTASGPVITTQAVAGHGVMLTQVQQPKNALLLSSLGTDFMWFYY